MPGGETWSPWPGRYFGLIVLSSVLLAVFGMISMLRMPSGIYPEVAFPRIRHHADPGPGGQDGGDLDHPSDRGGGGRGAGRPLGPLEDDPRRRAGGHRLLARHRHGPGPERRAGQGGRHQLPVSRRAPARSSSGRRRRSSRSFRSWSPAGRTRRRCATMPTMTCGRGSAGWTTCRYVAVQGRRRPRDRRRGRTRSGWRPPGCRSPTWPTGWARSTGCGRWGGWTAARLQYQVLVDSQAAEPVGPGGLCRGRAGRAADPRPRPGPRDPLARGPHGGRLGQRPRTPSR